MGHSRLAASLLTRQGGVVSKLWTYNSFTSLVLLIDIATWKTARTEKREVSLPTALNELG